MVIFPTFIKVNYFLPSRFFLFYRVDASRAISLSTLSFDIFFSTFMDCASNESSVCPVRLSNCPKSSCFWCCWSGECYKLNFSPYIKDQKTLLIKFNNFHAAKFLWLSVSQPARQKTDRESEGEWVRERERLTARRPHKQFEQFPLPFPFNV